MLTQEALEGLQRDLRATDLTPPSMRLIPAWPYGTECSVADDIPGIITAVCLREDRLTYEVVWWDRFTRNCQWLDECEIKCSKPKTARMGFRVQE